jgi:hypothetical protein
MSGSRSNSNKGNLHGAPDRIAARLRPSQRVSLEDATAEYMANGDKLGDIPGSDAAPQRPQQPAVPDFLADGEPTPPEPRQRARQDDADKPTPRRPDALNKQQADASTDPEPTRPEPTAAELDDKTRVAVGTTTVSLGELRSGYMRAADYTQKTQQLAAQRAELTKLRETSIPTVQTMLDKVFVVPQAPTIDLYNSNPQEYMRQVTIRDNMVAARADIERNLNGMVEANANEATAARQQRIASATNELLAMYPQWRGDDGKPNDTCRREMGEVVAHLSKAGFTDAEIAGIDDARYIPVIRKAAAYDAIKAGGADAKRITRPSPTAGAGSGNGQAAVPSNAGQRQPSGMFERTGHLMDAVSEYAGEIQDQQRQAMNGGADRPLTARGRRVLQ